MDILLYVLILILGVVIGFLLKRRVKYNDYSGTIVVSKDELTDKTLYSLELDDDFETLETKKVVVFKVDRT